MKDVLQIEVAKDDFQFALEEYLEVEHHNHFVAGKDIRDQIPAVDEMDLIPIEAEVVYQLVVGMSANFEDFVLLTASFE